MALTMDGTRVRDADDASLGAGYITAFNAVKLTAAEVAATFVPPPAFDSLLRADNSLLTGPRGSGKTTMLKMLTSPALEAWGDDRAASVRAAVTYSGVFVGTDRTWNAQLHSVLQASQHSDQLAWAAFSTHVFKSIIETMRARTAPVRENSSTTTHLRVTVENAAMREYCNYASQVLELPVATTLTGLSRALAARLAAIGQLRRLSAEGAECALPGWTALDALAAAEALLEAFNDAVGQPGHRWGLLFDELELAPPDIVVSLLEALRGHHPLVVFKLGLSPVHEVLQRLEGALGATHGQDFEHVQLTFARKQPGVRFAEALFKDEMARHKPPILVSPQRLLGPSEFDSRETSEEHPDVELSSGDRRQGRSGRQDPYARGSTLWKRFEALANADKSFAAWLDTQGLNLDTLDQLTPIERASKLRKIRNIVVVRSYYRAAWGSRRSRKSYGLYAGAESMLALPDGNPRLLIALIRQLLPLIADDRPGRVTREDQSLAIDTTVRRFRALIDAQQAEVLNGRATSVTDIVDLIGERLARGVVQDNFRAAPVLAVRVDRDLPSPILRLLSRAVNTGALVHVPKAGMNRPLSTIEGERFRLSHLLDPYYGLPPILGDEVALSSILREGRLMPAKASRNKKRRPGPGQGSLGIGETPA